MIIEKEIASLYRRCRITEGEARFSLARSDTFGDAREAKAGGLN